MTISTDEAGQSRPVNTESEAAMHRDWQEVHYLLTLYSALGGRVDIPETSTSQSVDKPVSPQEPLLDAQRLAEWHKHTQIPESAKKLKNAFR